MPLRQWPSIPRHVRQLRPAVLSLGLTVAGLSGCAGGPDMTALSTAAIPGMAEISTTETYARVARGANKCWFGPRGRFGSTHVLYAEAAPPSSGGAVEMIVHERDRTSERPWGARALRIRMTGGGTGPAIDFENLRMPDTEVDRMRKDVWRWAADDLSCDGEPPAGSVAVMPPQPARPQR